jgi:ribosome-associated protein
MNQPSPSAPRRVVVSRTPIELGQFLKFGGLAETGGAAKQAIGAGRVSLNGVVETRKGRKLEPGDTVTLDGRTIVVASA